VSAFFFDYRDDFFTFWFLLLITLFMGFVVDWLKILTAGILFVKGSRNGVGRGNVWIGVLAIGNAVALLQLVFEVFRFSLFGILLFFVGNQFSEFVQLGW
jgi:hypothetical protein